MGSLFDTYLPQGADKVGGGISGAELAKIPVNVQPNGVIYWSDPCPDMWFDMENLTNFADIDFYCALGNVSAQNPLEFNGGSFSIKLGILKNKRARTASLGGLAYQNRVTMRSTPF